MDFHLTREQELVRQMMHDFTENEVSLRIHFRLLHRRPSR